MTVNLKEIYNYFKERSTKIEVILGFLEEELHKNNDTINDNISDVILGTDESKPFMIKRAIESLFLKKPRWQIVEMVKEFEKMGRDVTYSNVANHLSHLARIGRLTRIGAGYYSVDEGVDQNDNT